MLDIWGEDLLPNGDDYINHTQAHERQLAGFRERDLRDHRRAEGPGRRAHRQDAFRLHQFLRWSRRISGRCSVRRRQEGRNAVHADGEPDLSDQRRRHGLCDRMRRAIASAAPIRCSRSTPARKSRSSRRPTIPTRCRATKPAPRTSSSTAGCRPRAASIT